jgi:hypothetical protein
VFNYPTLLKSGLWQPAGHYFLFLEFRAVHFLPPGSSTVLKVRSNERMSLKWKTLAKFFKGGISVFLSSPSSAKLTDVYKPEGPFVGSCCSSFKRTKKDVWGRNVSRINFIFPWLCAGSGDKKTLSLVTVLICLGLKFANWRYKCLLPLQSPPYYSATLKRSVCVPIVICISPHSYFWYY